MVLLQFGRAILRMRPRWPYGTLLAAMFLVDLGLRVVAERAFPDLATSGFLYARNPLAQEADDLGWPNLVAVGLVVALSLWVIVRRNDRSRLVAVGAALLIPGGVLNLGEPLLRGFTTDYYLIGDLIVNLGDLGLILGLPLVLLGALVSETAGLLRRRSARAA